jgi:hypothetical protein
LDVSGWGALGTPRKLAWHHSRIGIEDGQPNLDEDELSGDEVVSVASQTRAPDYNTTMIIIRCLYRKFSVVAGYFSYHDHSGVPQRSVVVQ